MANILIVDDDPTILELFKYIFEDAGYTVALAENGRQALDVIKGSIPDFMILDVLMPEMSGQELMAEIERLAVLDRRLNAIPFVVMTGENVMDKELNRAFASRPGFVCFIPKMTPPERVLEKAVEVIKKPK